MQQYRRHIQCHNALLHVWVDAADANQPARQPAGALSETQVLEPSSTASSCSGRFPLICPSHSLELRESSLHLLHCPASQCYLIWEATASIKVAPLHDHAHSVMTECAKCHVAHQAKAHAFPSLNTSKQRQVRHQSTRACMLLLLLHSDNMLVATAPALP